MKKYLIVLLFLFSAQQAGACFSTIYFDSLTASKLTAIIEKATGVGAAVIPQEYNGNLIFVVIDKQSATESCNPESACEEGTSSPGRPARIDFPVYSNPSFQPKVLIFGLSGHCYPHEGFGLNYPHITAPRSPGKREFPVMPKEVRNRNLNCGIIQSILAHE